ncbi:MULTISPECIES: hypothetical protein [unclassified Rhodococcus (in: high G+C Gram-positive bacteria)]|uniref:hypothetical protein n=1 Tax=unclassified Rhodococcus (in: high G+C Gram-positive bacteria) TaxID=192944 RepID=UPI002078620E|nr:MULTISPECIES: hypothetical protein [unclassified Rhodococcus (in: high G+C Gram-positive bacteria)]
MTAADAVRTMMRVPYELVRVPALVLDEAVLPAFFDADADAPARLACEHLLVGCDRADARWLADGAAAARADRLRRRSAPVRYAIACHLRQDHVATDAVLARHGPDSSNDGTAREPAAAEGPPSPATGHTTAGSVRGRLVLSAGGWGNPLGAGVRDEKIGELGCDVHV